MVRLELGDGVARRAQRGARSRIALVLALSACSRDRAQPGTAQAETRAPVTATASATASALAVTSGTAATSAPSSSAEPAASAPTVTAAPGSAPPKKPGSTNGDGAARLRFAVIGDYGVADRNEAEVAKLVKSWKPEFVITTGDNNYPRGGSDTIDENIGQFYHEFIFPYHGRFAPGALENRFFPVLGNHDWLTAGAQPYLDYFVLPGNERYYEFARGSVQFFALDSDPHEPDGVAADSVQAKWLKARLAAASAPWRIVVQHHPPFSSGPHGSDPVLQWPFKAWGASALFAGHDHDYERVELGGFPYLVIGLGGNSAYKFNAPVPGSVVRYNASFGAELVEADERELVARFYTTRGEQIDELRLLKAAPTK